MRAGHRTDSRKRGGRNGPAAHIGHVRQILPISDDPHAANDAPVADAPRVADALHLPEVVGYEQRLNQNPRWALSEGSRFFDDKSAVQDALRKIASRLNEFGIPYAVVDSMALFHYGYRR